MFNSSHCLDHFHHKWGGCVERQQNWQSAAGVGPERGMRASIFVFAGGEGNIAGQAGFVWDIIHHMKGEEATDIGKTHWAVIQAKTRDLKVCKFQLIMFI